MNLSVNPEALQRGKWILTRLLGETIPDVLELNQRLRIVLVLTVQFGRSGSRQEFRRYSAAESLDDFRYDTYF